MYDKSIQYSPETCDYACYLDGELVGFGRSYHEAEVMLDQLVFELLGAPVQQPRATELPPPELPRDLEREFDYCLEALHAAVRLGNRERAKTLKAELDELARALGIVDTAA